MKWRHTQSIGKPENGIRREEQSTLTRIMNRARDIIIALADLAVGVCFGIGFGVGSGTPERFCAAPSFLPGLEGDIS